MILNLLIILDICMHHYQILLIIFQKTFFKKCDDYKGVLEYEKVNGKFFVYNCLVCEKNYQIKFDKYI